VPLPCPREATCARCDNLHADLIRLRRLLFSDAWKEQTGLIIVNTAILKTSSLRA